MNENLFEAQYNVTKKSKLRKFYESNKIFIFLIVSVLIIGAATFSYYSGIKEKNKILLSDNYIDAKIYIKNGDKNKAKDILKKIILANDSTYSTLSLFLILNENLITEQVVLSDLFNHILENNEFEEEIKNLIIFKKALFQSNFLGEFELLKSVKPLINSDTLWKPHALLLLGDYFFSKREYEKAKEFYTQILSLKNLNNELYDQARSQLLSIK